ncbi:MAG: hypothetical protein Q4G25_08035 [Paracoccus sp. (in: a-proteobacteria)]|nr:hypothetical protein [Paracoccus sp. (in: a-proteobacteria)]
MRFLLALFVMLIPPAAHAAADEPAMLCEWAASQAAAETGVPADIMGALTLTETGRRHAGQVRPWAWSVNAEGAGSWFDDPATALAFAEERVAGGRLNLDIGCFQLNYRWHGQHFASVADMFDPLTNARYAARFVADLYHESGDWRRAAGMFHSRTPAHATRYLARFDELRAGLRSGGGAPHGMPETYNRFAAADPAVIATLPRPSRPVRIIERRMLLGAPIGTPRSDSPGSLTAIGGPRVALLSGGTALIGSARAPLISPGDGPLIGPGITRSRPRDGTRGQRRARAPARDGPAERGGVMAARDGPDDPGPDETPEWADTPLPAALPAHPARIPGATGPPALLTISGAEELL